MGNSSSSSGEFLGTESTPGPKGHGLEILDDEPKLPSAQVSPAHEPSPVQEQRLSGAGAARVDLGLRQFVWNPFDMPTREHCPDLQQALPYDPEAPPSPSSGPSIDEMSRLQREDLAEQAQTQQRPPSLGPEAEAQCQDDLACWFEHRAATQVGGASA